MSERLPRGEVALTETEDMINSFGTDKYQWKLGQAAHVSAQRPPASAPISPEFFAADVCPWKVSDIQARILPKLGRNFFRIKPKSQVTLAVRNQKFWAQFFFNSGQGPSEISIVRSGANSSPGGPNSSLAGWVGF